MKTTVLVDGRNVQRSIWPNVPDAELVERCCAWARREGVHVLLVFDGAVGAPDADREDCTVVGTGRESADDWLTREAGRLAAAELPFQLVTSDRELRRRAGSGAESVTGGGSFLRALSR